MPVLSGQSIGGILDPQLTNLTLNQRRTMQNLVAQGIAPNIARNLAIALTKSAAVPVQKKSYHQAFSEAAKEILPDGLTAKLHVRARAIAGGYAKKAKRMTEGEVVDAVKADGLVPPKGVQAACRRGLDLAPEYGGPGLTEGAKARAKSMAQGNAVSADQLRRMHSFFSRHDSYEKQSSPPSPGYVSWLLWGGDAGQSWASAKKDSVGKSARCIALAKKAKALGAAFSHARASGEKQDHKSRKRRANKWLKENGHEPIGKMAPNAADVRAEQFLNLVRDRKKKQRPQDMSVKKAEWSEADHPRAENGQFGDGPTVGKKAATKEEKDAAVKAYGNLSYRAINEQALKYGSGEKPTDKFDKAAQAHVAPLSQAIHNSKLEKDTKLYRGMRLPSDVKVGDTLAPHGFTSASASKSAATGFAKASDKSGGYDRVVATIRAPKGMPALDVDKSGLGTAKNEKEFIFDHRQSFRIVADNGVDAKGIRQIEIEPVSTHSLQKAECVAVSVPCRIVKAEQQDWQRLVWSVVYEPDTLDLHGDFMDADTIQKAAHDAMRSGIYVNSEHRGDPLDAEVVESYTAPCDFVLATDAGDVTVTKGSWVQCLHIKDDAHWQGVLDGTYTGFSLEGMALAQAAA